ncbi:hypothetical protein LH427_09635 [Laribacter hongkongensis]|uniref:hypothetical protein n=1 Tax=Laribacter hongkongensis TaxID=168471 RepID=UPI001EFD40E2|nr:hypothetical protein [Laribacter hongkongensis]MCG8993233.1 hypothetical protein [Laribacter hongkongensis]MCG8997948.1 hypothetical protein [Laribacter hongkongensis]MCG9002341.1 hypothetical protein [Laribacter hongkongensis]MCG9005651.1 hypothetical protein [Laribacter hongkongensis]MCG9008788.1 hypothetical protein [Laribacter hongkongensis]
MLDFVWMLEIWHWLRRYLRPKHAARPVMPKLAARMAWPAPAVQRPLWPVPRHGQSGVAAGKRQARKRHNRRRQRRV